MCRRETKKYLLCGHRVKELIKCKESLEKLKKKPERGFFRNLFSSSSSAAKNGCSNIIKCSQQAIIAECERCLFSQEYRRGLKLRALKQEQQQQQQREQEHISKREAQEVQEQAQRIEAARRAHNQHEASRRLQRREEEKRRTYRCSGCSSEDRRTSDRSANRGLCCARGLEEFQAGEGTGKGHGMQINSTRYGYVPQAEQLQDIPLTPVPLNKLRKMTSTEVAREAASAAAKRYGWTRHKVLYPDQLEEELVRSFMTLNSRTVPLEVPPPPPPQQQHEQQQQKRQPHYEDLGINWERWNESTQTSHGFYPPPAVPAPEKPLPQISQTQARTPHRVCGQEEWPVELDGEIRRPCSICGGKLSSQSHPKNHNGLSPESQVKGACLDRCASPEPQLTSRGSHTSVSPVSPLPSGGSHRTWSPVSLISNVGGWGGDHSTSQNPALEEVISDLDQSIDEALRLWIE